MQTMNEFVDSIDVPEKLLPDFLYLIQWVENQTALRFYMCFSSVSDDFIEWMTQTIEENIPQKYYEFSSDYGIIALFEYKKWMTVDDMGTGEDIDPNPSDDEYKVANELRLEFVNLLLNKIKI